LYQAASATSSSTTMTPRSWWRRASTDSP